MSVTTIAKSTKKIKKNKSFAFRMTASPNLEFLLNYLENRYIGLDKTEIVKLALTELYEQSKQKEVLMDITPAPNPFKSDEEYSQWWNANKNDLRK
jgi:hypothetical protein